MSFNKKINEYIEILDCNAKELSIASGISPAVISRYKNGDRIPKYPSEQFNNIVSGIYKLAINKKINISKKDIEDELLDSLNIIKIDFETFRQNLNLIIISLNINVADMSRFIGYDSSYLSKIRSGNRTPHNILDFVDAISKYIINVYSDEKSINIIASLINENTSNLTDSIYFKDKLIQWLSKANDFQDSIEITQSFLNKLDDFDLSEYIKAIHFDTLKVPTIPFSIPKSKSYYGLPGFKESQLDLLKTIAISKSKDDIYFYSNMSMIEASKDVDFTKKFMFGLAACLKKEIPIKMIHDLDRPYKELMLGLEGWLPLYMTGLITPHYLKNNANELFSHISCANSIAAMSGYYATGNIHNSIYYLTTKKEELKYYISNVKQLWKKSIPLMDIYNVNNKNDYNNLLIRDKDEISDRINIYSNLPLYTLNEKLLTKILLRNNINTEDKEKILNNLKTEQKRIKDILDKNSIIDEIPILSREEFENNSISLSLSSIFYDEKIMYNYDEYIEHINLIKEFANKNQNYSYKKNTRNPFKNVNVCILPNKYVILSKENAPSIHFAIYHPILVKAIEKFEIQIIE